MIKVFCMSEAHLSLNGRNNKGRAKCQIKMCDNSNWNKIRQWQQDNLRIEMIDKI